MSARQTGSSVADTMNHAVHATIQGKQPELLLAPDPAAAAAAAAAIRDPIQALALSAGLQSHQNSPPRRLMS